MGQSTSKYRFQESDWPHIWAIRDASVLDWKVGLKPNEIIAIQRCHDDLPVEITPTLYLGNCQCALDLVKLQRLGIQRVLNMAGPLAVLPKTIEQAMQEVGIKYKVIAAEDETDYPLLEKHWEEAHTFIHEGENEKVLVYCIAGQNRSALIVAAEYLVSTPGTNVIDTVRHIRRRRGNVALQNEGFQEQLVAFARLHNLLGPAPTPTCPPSAKRTKNNKTNPLEKLTL